MLNQEEYFSDSVRHAEGGTVVALRSTDQRVACSSPTQRKYFVCNYCFAGARPTDNHAKTSYKLNAAGLPEVAYIQNNYHADLTLSDVNNGAVEDIDAVMYMNYDESGQRIWTRVKKEDADYAEFTLSGVGVYSADIGAQTGYTLKRMDLVAGGYRDGINGKAYFPVTDAQGNVRGYANDEGLVSAYDYYAYGGVEKIAVNETDDNKRWQSKEHDEPIQKIYFGARYFDPFFGMWMSPDPAAVFFRETYTPLKCRSIIEKDILQRSNGEAVLLKHSFRASAQFANPYSYGGDPINGKDRDGRLFVLDDFVIAVVGGTISYTVGGIRNGDWANADAFGNFVIGAASADVGYNVLVLTGGNTTAAGATGASLGYTYNTAVLGRGSFSMSGLGKATVAGVAGGAVGGAIAGFGGQYLGQTASSAIGAYAGGATSVYVSGGLQDNRNWTNPNWSSMNREGLWAAGTVLAVEGVKSGVNSLAEKENAQRYLDGNSNGNEYDRFIDENGLRREPFSDWKSAEASENLANQTSSSHDLGFSDPSNPSRRFDGGLHVTSDGSKYMGHYDFFNPSVGPVSMVGHFFEANFGLADYYTGSYQNRNYRVNSTFLGACSGY